MRRLVPFDEAVVVEKLVPGGDGMGRLEDGRPVFAERAFVGDVLRLEEGEDRKSFVFARSFRVETPSTFRRTPECPDCDRCGGCDWMWIDEAEQLRAKGDLIAQALERIGRISPPGPIVVHPSPRERRYRSRVRLQVKEGKVGFFARGSHELVEVSDCLVTSEEVWHLVKTLREIVGGSPTDFEDVSHVEVRVFGGNSPLFERASLHLSLRPSAARGKERKAVVKRLRHALRPLQDQATLRIAAEPSKVQQFSPIKGVEVRAPIGGFTQVNEVVNQQMVELVVSEVVQSGAQRFLDLYCGSGNFALPLLHRGLTGVGVEQNTEAIEAARNEVEARGLSGHFTAQACDRYLRGLSPDEKFDVVIADPPRAGAKGAIPSLLRLRAPLLLMIACDPANLARDLGELVRGGYRLESVEGFDMFPQTHHVETLAILRADESPRLSEPGL